MKTVTLTILVCTVCIEAAAAELVRGFGTNTSQPIKLDVPTNAPGAPVFVAVARQAIKDSSSAAVFDNATCYSTISGRMQGQRTLLTVVGRCEREGDQYYWAGSGECDSVNMGQKDQDSYCSGSWQVLPGGSGRYAGVSGSGTWRQKEIKADGVVVYEWDSAMIR